MPCFREIEYGPDGIQFERTLLNQMPVVVVVISGEIPNRLVYLALKKPFVALTPDPSLYSQLKRTPNIFPVLLGESDDLPSIRFAISEILARLARDRKAPASISTIDFEVTNGALSLRWPQLSFIKPIAIAPPEAGMPVCYLLNRLANTMEHLEFGISQNNMPVAQYFELIKLATVHLALLEHGRPPGDLASPFSSQELEGFHTLLLGDSDQNSKLDLFLTMGGMIEKMRRRGVRFFSVPTIRSATLRNSDPPSISAPRLPYATESAIYKSVRAFCGGTRNAHNAPPEDASMREGTSHFLVREQALLACHSALLAGRCFALPMMCRVSVTSLFEEIKALHGTLYGMSRKAHKQFRLVQKNLTASVPKELIDAITAGGNEIVFYSDLPLEWLTINDIPICLIKPVSRIPITLTRFSSLHAVMEGKCAINVSDPSKTLVLDLMADHERVKRYSHLMRSNLMRCKVELTYVNPRSPQDVISALKQHNPEIVFVDAHGRYDSASDKLYLKVGDNEFETSILFGKELVPKIWIMSSCQTTMAEAVSGSIARDLLSRGAICVIGTLSSVDAMLAALFFSVLMEEIYVGKVFPRSQTLDQAIHFTQVYMTRIWEPLLPLLRKYEFDTGMTARINLFLEDRRRRHTERGLEDTIDKQLEIDSLILNQCLRDHGLLEIYNNLMQTGRSFPETLLFSSLGFPKGVILRAGAR